MKLTRLLSFRLLAGIFIMMVGGITTLTLFLADIQAQRYTDYFSNNAIRVSDIIKRSTHYSMMLNRREDIYNIINTIGSEPGIEGIRIYNKRGDISFSTVGSEVGTTADLSDKACIACHTTGASTSVTPVNPELVRYFQSPKGYRVMGVITPIKNDPTCSTPDCHAHSASQTILGVLDVLIPLNELDENIAQFERSYYLGGMSIIIVITVLSGFFFWRTVNVPVKRLKEGTEEIMRGNLDHTIDVHTKDELGSLTKSFNHMTRTLKEAQTELEDLNKTLEQRVQRKTDELRRAQANLIQVEKMVSLGTLAATVAHELNNPLEGILTYAKLIRKRMQNGDLTPEQTNEITDELKMIADETSRCGTIVKNLLLFSRRKVGEFKENDLRSIIAQSMKLIDHHLKMNNVQLQTIIADNLPTVRCDAEQILQALLALEINAVEAMPQGGTLRIESAVSGNETVTIRIIDSGIGIHSDDLPHIFEPFYTTKKEGKGTGLGLAVVYGIIERHGGTISVESAHNAGTTFTITLPQQFETET